MKRPETGPPSGSLSFPVREPRIDVDGLLAGADHELACGIGFRPGPHGGSGGGGFCFGEAGPADDVVDEVVVGLSGHGVAEAFRKLHPS